MGQKTNPIGARLGIIRGWESNWYGSKKDYASKLIEDNKIRTYLNARINKGGIAKIVIERTLNKLIVTLHTSKPGIIIGKGGGEVDRVRGHGFALHTSPAPSSSTSACNVHPSDTLG